MTRRLVQDYTTGSRAYQPTHAVQLYRTRFNWELILAFAVNLLCWGGVAWFLWGIGS